MLQGREINLLFLSPAPGIEPVDAKRYPLIVRYPVTAHEGICIFIRLGGAEDDVTTNRPPTQNVNRAPFARCHYFMPTSRLAQRARHTVWGPEHFSRQA